MVQLFGIISENVIVGYVRYALGKIYYNYCLKLPNILGFVALIETL